MTNDTLATTAIIVAVIAIAVLGGLAVDTRSTWYQGLKKPDWQPSPKVFAPVWTVIYVLLAISAILTWHATEGNVRTQVMLLYAINGVLNLAWSFIFFRARSPMTATIDIGGLVLVLILMIIRVWPVSIAAALLLVPYLAWVTYAAILNWSIARRN